MLAQSRGSVPIELAYIAIAERFGVSPTEVDEWPEDVFEDVMLYLGSGGDNRGMRALEY